MSIWSYEDVGDLSSDWGSCAFCATPMRLLHRGEEQLESTYREVTAVTVCDTCGWWSASRSGFETAWGQELEALGRSVSAVLKDLALHDLSTPLAEVRDRLTADYEVRHEVHPKLFEDVVGSVFGDHGYQHVVTGYTCDGGVDVILELDQERIGVQVKNTRNTVGVSQIRELVGALVLGGFTSGVFVTTSRFSEAGRRAAEGSLLTSAPIKLVNAEEFYAELALAQRDRYRDARDIDVGRCLQRLTDKLGTRGFGTY